MSQGEGTLASVVNADVDQAVAQLACQQQGLFYRHEALAQGASASLVQRRLASGRWLTVGHGAYALPGVPLSWERRQGAACTAAGPAAVLSHRAAAALHGFPDCRQGAPEITVPWTRATHRGQGRVHRVTDLAASDVTVVRGIRVTKRLRTLLDLAAVISSSKLAAVLDDLVAARVVALEDVVTAARALRRSRDNEAAALGWRTLRFGWDDLLTRPDWVCQVVRCCLSGTH